MKSEFRNSGFRLALLPLLLMLTSCAGASESRPNWLPDKAFLQTGIAKSARSMLVGTSWAPFWNHAVANGQVEVHWEAAFGRWAGDREANRYQTRWTTQVGLTPVLRWQAVDDGPHWFIEAGIGANIVTPIYRRDSKSFSTAFNFGDHVGIGWRFGASDRHELALRIQHFSNAGIKLPNPGENFRQLRYTCSF